MANLKENRILTPMENWTDNGVWDIAARPLWAQLFYVFCGVLILLSFIRGWRDGLSRQLAELFSLVLGIVGGIIGSAALTPLLADPLGIPQLIFRWGSGIIIAIILVGILSLIAPRFFRKTREQTAGRRKLAWGLGGAVIGALGSLVLIAVIVIGSSLLGTMGRTFLVLHPSDSLKEEEDGEKTLAIRTLIVVTRFDNSISETPLRNQLLKANPVPEKTYRIMDKALQTAANEEALKRWLDQPGTQQLMSHPRIRAIQEDEEAMALVKERDLAKLMLNPHFKAALDDPAFQEVLFEYEFEASLDAALKGIDQRLPPGTTESTPFLQLNFVLPDEQ